jgi:KamA family protein
MTIKHKAYKSFGPKQLGKIPQLGRLDPEVLLHMRAVAEVFPFRANNHVVDDLIRWEDVPDDPIFQLTFPQPEMLEPSDLRSMVELVRGKAPPGRIREAAREIQFRLNPHPAGQTTLNVPRLDGSAVPGMQHKYRETVLFFPRQGQTCHAYCTYCFRWPQFVGLDDFQFASEEVGRLIAYLRRHREVTSVLLTGGDPLIMRTDVLRRYIRPLLDARLEHVTSIRIGTKATTYWPYRFLTDRDADDLLRLFEEVVDAGKHLAVMAHVTHPRELDPPVTRAAIRRISGTGAVVRCQAPLIRHVNDDPEIWAEMWRKQVSLGAVPYYMFVERDTGPRNYFEVPLAEAHGIFRRAYRRISGLARTVRGPSMSATPGKVVVDGVTRVAGEDVFVLKFIQARDPKWVGRPFFAALDEDASWLDQLRPALGAREFFFERGLREMNRGKGDPDEPRPGPGRFLGGPDEVAA